MLPRLDSRQQAGPAYYLHAMQYQFTLNDESATERLGAAIAEHLPIGSTIALVGPLGAGKTRLVQAVAAACGIPRGDVTSPTFVVIQEYNGNRAIVHMDAFRVIDDDEFLELGPDEYFESDALTFIEWADRVTACLPQERIEIHIEPLDLNARAFTLIPHGETMHEVVERIATETRFDLPRTE